MVRSKSCRTVLWVVSSKACNKTLLGLANEFGCQESTGNFRFADHRLNVGTSLGIPINRNESGEHVQNSTVERVGE